LVVKADIFRYLQKTQRQQARKDLLAYCRLVAAVTVKTIKYFKKLFIFSMPHQHETKSTTIQAMAIALCLIILLSGFAWIIFEKVNDNLFSQESANHLEQFQRNLKIFMVWLLVVLTGISVWVGHRLPRRGWFWNVCVAALFYASVCVFLVFSRMTTDVTAVIARWGYIENLFLLIMIAAAYAGQYWAAKAMPPIWIKPWHVWEGRILVGSALLGVGLLASSHLPIQFNKFWPLSKESTMAEQKTGKDKLETQRFLMAAQTGDFDVINELTQDQNSHEQLEMALFWLLLANDYGHADASVHLNCILETTILRYDDEGFALGQAHYDLMLAHLLGDVGMRHDHGKAALHAAEICAMFNTNMDFEAEAQRLEPAKRPDFENLIDLARSKC
jgi:hypothetical protein